MSTILKALRRLEEERSVQPDRPLLEQVASTKSHTRRGLSAMTLLLAAGLGLAGGAALLFLWPPAASEPIARAPSKPVTVASVPVRPEPSPPRRPVRSEPSRSAEPRTTPQSLSPAALTSEVEVVTQPRPAEVVVPAPNPSAAAAQAESPDGSRRASTSERPITTPAPPPVERATPARPAFRKPEEKTTRVAEAPAAPGVENVPAPDLTPEPVTQLAKASPPSSQAARAKPEPIAAPPKPAAEPAPRAATESPKLEPVPERKLEPEPPVESEPEPAVETEPEPKPRARKVVRSPIPDIVVERTIWHPSPERRVAVVALEGSDERIRLHQGDVVGPLVVKEIEPSAVLFGHEGVELRRGVGAP